MKIFGKTLYVFYWLSYAVLHKFGHATLGNRVRLWLSSTRSYNRIEIKNQLTRRQAFGVTAIIAHLIDLKVPL